MSLGPQAAAAISQEIPACLLRIDLHCHSRFSFDGLSTSEQMLIAARDRGLDGFVVTDHDTSEAVEHFRDLGALDPDGVAVNGLLIIPGQEISTREGRLPRAEKADKLYGSRSPLVQEKRTDG
ncbi:MAG: PHP domain-containing protein [Chthoniobacterales bacterium]|nr:PHP domain-containing protein [Chthoniobacterales bacterium]